jgi:hypothetical protein
MQSLSARKLTLFYVYLICKLPLSHDMTPPTMLSYIDRYKMKMRVAAFLLIIIVFLFVNLIEARPKDMTRRRLESWIRRDANSNYMKSQQQMFQAEMKAQNAMQTKTTEVSVTTVYGR